MIKRTTVAPKIFSLTTQEERMVWNYWKGQEHFKNHRRYGDRRVIH